jgi:hypothetical protein
MKIFLKIIILFLVAILACFVDAWGFQVFWNDIILNIWQMFASTDVTTTMRIPYGAFLAISVGIGLVWTRKSDTKNDIDINSTEDFAKLLGKLFTILLSKICQIYIALAIISVVF